MLTVVDSGPGIDPEFLPRIFDRFTQADSSLTRVSGGLGVGLALVRQLVELHGGDIQARNRPGAAGAVFTVRFPAEPGDAARAKVSPPDIDGWPGLGQLARRAARAGG